ncbi:MAG: hypothetical protein GKR88_15195 [Flavobacteriaceae bacterium]|nr:MAG: hypothetical protein GKR88_15195 [Flavobacteriaceae bacterium]
MNISHKKLHIVSFDVPYPPDYGGVVDVFYKIKTLAELGIDIYLHTFEYGRKQQKILKKYCKKVFYYKRNSFTRSFLSAAPFIVKSRANAELVANLNTHHFPILFEGLHTTCPVYENKLTTQQIFVRAHNIEHRFYRGLSESESNIFKKKFFRRESKKLKKYQNILKNVKGVFTISPFEQEYFHKKIGNHSTYIPAFHDVQRKKYTTEKGVHILYHGNVLVSENVKAALFLIDTYKNSKFKLVIASSYTNEKLLHEIRKFPNISFSKINTEKDLSILLDNAHVNALPTFQKTGIKLKLLNTLYRGKFIIANTFMVEDTGLEGLCELANTKEEFLAKTKKLFTLNFTSAVIGERMQLLEKWNPINGARKIIDIIFEQP